MLWKRGGTMVGTGKWIAEVKNDPWLHTFRAFLHAKHTWRTSVLLPQPEPRLQTKHWFIHLNPVPASIRDNHDAYESYRRAVLQADAVVHSDYWQRVLGGPALCVLHEDGQIAFRISANEHDGLLMFKDDAVIQLTTEGPKAHSTVTHKALPEECPVRFHFAASLAARLHLLSARDWNIDNYINAIYDDEEALEKSAKTWTDNNHHHLTWLNELMMSNGSPAN